MFARNYVLEFANVFIGALTAVILALSPIFTEASIHTFARPASLVVLLVLFCVNGHFLCVSYRRRSRWLGVVSGIGFLVCEAILIGNYVVLFSTDLPPNIGGSRGIGVGLAIQDSQASLSIALLSFVMLIWIIVLTVSEYALARSETQ